MNYEEVLNSLYQFFPTYQQQGSLAIKVYSLQKIAYLCEQIGNPQKRIKAIHIAGTNGKGSIAHSLAAVLQTAGYRTGLYTSPHLKKFQERIRLNGQVIDKAYVVKFFQKYIKLFQKVSPSFFEITVMMAYDFFAYHHVHIAVIEVGMGGRLDATNIITPILSIITNIDWDHSAFLGDTLEKIAKEKAGIIKNNIPIVTGHQYLSVLNIIKTTSKKQKAYLYESTKNYTVHVLKNYDSNFIIDIIKQNNIWISSLNFSLQGLYQLKNIPIIAQSIQVLQKLGWKIQTQHICYGLENIYSLTGLRGRWAILAKKPMIICDICHNEAGVRQVIAQINTLQYDQLHIVWGMVQEKNIRNILRHLPKNAQYYFCQANIPRAMCAQKLNTVSQKFGLYGTVIMNVTEAFKKAVNCATDKSVILVGGSTFVVAEVL